MQRISLIFFYLLFIEGNGYAKGSSDEPKPSSSAVIHDYMNPDVIAAAFYNPDAEKGGGNISTIFRSYVVEPKSEGSMLYIEKVNFAEPDTIEWQNRIYPGNIVRSFDKSPKDPREYVGSRIKYIKWEKGAFAFGFALSEYVYSCTIGIDSKAQPNCKRSKITKD
jgi:hypothetical protein